MPSLQQLRVFEAVAHHESISAAAKTIHLSQPSVTLAIGQLEGKVGAPLFDRRRTGCYVTSAGAIFLPRVTRMSAQIRQALCEPIVGQPFADRSSVTALERKITDAQVRSLIAISESVSFDEAARRIGITEPSLHRSARTLERILRRTLYRRTAQGYTTTPPATELARRFKVAAREIEYGMDEIGAEHGPFVSRIVVGNIPHSNMHLLSAAINEILAKFPDASVDVLDGHYNDLLNALRTAASTSSTACCGGRNGRSTSKRSSCSPTAMRWWRGAIIRSGRCARSRSADLARYDWIMPPQGTPRRHAFEQIFKGRNLKPKVSVETTSIGIYRALLGASDRLSLFSHREVEADEPRGSKRCLIARRA